MIPSFDPSKDILTIEKSIEHVDDLAIRLGQSSDHAIDTGTVERPRTDMV